MQAMTSGSHRIRDESTRPAAAAAAAASLDNSTVTPARQPHLFPELGLGLPRTIIAATTFRLHIRKQFCASVVTMATDVVILRPARARRTCAFTGIAQATIGRLRVFTESMWVAPLHCTGKSVINGSLSLSLSLCVCVCACVCVCMSHPDTIQTTQSRITKSLLLAQRKTSILGCLQIFQKFESGHPKGGH